MAVPILIVTPTSPLGEFLAQALTGGGDYEPVVATSLEAALVQIETRAPACVLLDAELPPAPGEAVRQMRRLVADLPVLIWPGEKEGEMGRELDLPVHCLSAPLSLTALLDALEGMHLTAETAPPPQAAGLADEKILPGLPDAQRAAQHLTRLSLGASAQAALITHKGVLWAYAGQLPHAAAEELAQATASQWAARPPDQAGDLARFVRLQATMAEYMLYATSLGESTVLALVFDAEMPFSRIRAQASSLARALSAAPDRVPPGVEPLPLALDPSPLPFADPEHDEVDEIVDNEEEGEYGQVNVSIPPLFAEERIPPAQPSAGFRPHHAAEDDLFVPDEWQPEVELGRDVLPEQFSIPVDHAPPAPERTPVQKFQAAGSLPQVAADIQYTAAVIPRFPQHLLVGEMAHQLAAWMKELHVAYGWRLEHIAVRPGWMTWVSRTPPEISAAHLLEVLCQQTSRRIFEESPPLARANPSGNFWAPGCLVSAGSQTLGPETLKSFSQQVRRSQGLQVD
jgi:CheY-like chemotaxis protein/REP element-mobilizing transposase RayT